MRRLIRICLSGATILSLVFALASAILWVRGYWWYDNMGYAGRDPLGREHRFGGLASGSGGVSIYVGTFAPGIVTQVGPEGWDWRSYRGRPVPYAGVGKANWLGLGYASAQDSYARWGAIVFPSWLATTVFAVLPAGRVVVMIRRRRVGREGHCEGCGYDLRATPERCPECGAVPERN